MTNKISVSILLLVLVLSLAACNDSEDGTVLSVQTVEYETSVIDGSGTMYEIDYLREEWDLRPMVKEADLVLVGEIVSQERFGLANLFIWSEVKVSQISRGKCKADTVKVLHKRTCPIVLGDEYLLVLKSAQPWYDEGYEVMGGHHGIFRQLDGEIQVTDAGFIPVIEKKFGGKDFTIYDLAKWFKRF